MKSMSQIKKQAARLTFGHLLNEDQLVQAVDMVDTDYKDETTSSLIDYIILIANKFGIDKTTRKTLYPKFFLYLNNPTTDSPTNNDRSNQPQQDTSISKQKPSELPIVDIIKSIQEGTASTQEKNTNNLSVMAIVFSHFIKSLVFHFPSEPKELLEEVSIFVKNKKQLTGQEIKKIVNWLNEYEADHVMGGVSEKTMCSLVHLFYLSLCELCGPIKTDEIIHLALNDCKKLQEAKKFDPKRFL